MRIWFIHPIYYDKKGLLAQWNEGLLLRNIIYGSKHKITIEKEKNKKKEEVKSTRQPGWINHPFSKRVLRYKKNLQKKIINTYLNNLRLYGVEVHGIKFNEEYLDKKFIDNKIKVPILIEQVRQDHKDALDKMLVRDINVYNKIKAIKSTEKLDLLEPYYLEKDFDKYLKSLNSDYVKWANNDRGKLIGTEK